MRGLVLHCEFYQIGGVRSSPNDETSAKRNEVCDREFGAKTHIVNDASPEISPRVKKLFVFLLIFTFINEAVSDVAIFI